MSKTKEQLELEVKRLERSLEIYKSQLRNRKTYTIMHMAWELFVKDRGLSNSKCIEYATIMYNDVYGKIKDD